MDSSTEMAAVSGERQSERPHQLSPTVLLYQPSSAVPDPSAPRLIFLASWMGARDSHMAKYTVKYRELFPTSTIVLVKSSFMYYFRPEAGRRA